MKRYLRDYITKNLEEDATIAVLSALDNCEQGDILYLGGGELHFYPTYAFEKFYYISNNDCGIKKIVFPLLGKRGLTIDGEGAKLVFHGKILPFVIDHCKDIEIKNLSIDYAQPMYFEAKIIKSAEDFVEMEYDDSVFHLSLKNRKFCFSGENWEISVKKVLVNEFDESYKGPTAETPTYFAFVGEPEEEPPHYANLYRFLKASKPEINRLRLEGDIGYKHTVGKYWLCSFDDREYPGIFMNESKDVDLQNINLYYTPSMGVICQMCENLTLERVIAVPGKGRLLSVNADATHFVNCSGLISMKECQFESMMDDAMNVHGIYVPIVKKMDEHKVVLKFGHHQQRGINIFKTEDRIRLIDNKTLQPVEEYVVVESKLVNSDYILLETKEKLPEMIPKGYVFENYSRMPEVYIKGCRSGYNRPRGFLLSTNRPVMVEDCTFYNLHHAISVKGDANSWYESGPCGEIVLRNNHFENAAYAGTAIIEGGPAVITPTDQKYHGTLTVKNNYFKANEPRNITVFSFKQIIEEDNYYLENEQVHN